MFEIIYGQIAEQGDRSFYPGMSYAQYLEINDYTQIYPVFTSYVSEHARVRSTRAIDPGAEYIVEIFFAQRDFPRAYIQKRYRRRARTASERICLIIRDRGCLVNYSADEWFVN